MHRLSHLLMEVRNFSIDVLHFLLGFCNLVSGFVKILWVSIGPLLIISDFQFDLLLIWWCRFSWGLFAVDVCGLLELLLVLLYSQSWLLWESCWWLCWSWSFCRYWGRSSGRCRGWNSLLAQFFNWWLGSIRKNWGLFSFSWYGCLGHFSYRLRKRKDWGWCLWSLCRWLFLSSSHRWGLNWWSRHWSKSDRGHWVCLCWSWSRLPRSHWCFLGLGHGYLCFQCCQCVGRLSRS